VDEWKDLTGLPYVHGLFGSAEKAKLAEPESRCAPSGAKNRDLHSKEKIAEDYARKKRAFGSRLPGIMPMHFLILSARKRRLRSKNFIRYAYYHGVIGDIPDIRFFFDSSPGFLNRQSDV